MAGIPPYQPYGAATNPYTTQVPVPMYAPVPQAQPQPMNSQPVVPRVSTAPQIASMGVTPSPWPSPAPVVRFGVGGKVVMYFPSRPQASQMPGKPRPSLSRNPGVRIYPISALIGGSPFYQQYASAPPCIPVNIAVPTKYPTNDHKKYIEDVISLLSSTPVLEDSHLHQNDPKWGHIRREEGNAMLWKIVKLVCDALIANKEAYKKTSAQVMAEGSKVALMQQMSPVPRSRVQMTEMPAEDLSALPEVQALLLSGKLDVACETAIRVCVIITQML